MNPNPTTEADLHARVDGQLSPERAAALHQWLAQDPAAADRLEAYEAQARALHAQFDPVLDEPLPPALLAAAQGPAATPSPATASAAPGRWSAWRLAAGVALLLAGTVIGWGLRGQWPGAVPGQGLASGSHPLVRQAVLAHAVFSPEVRRPVEVDAAHEEQLVTWLSKRLGRPMRAPKLATQGFELMGGRLLPGGGGPVAQFMYQDSSGQRMTLYVSTDASGLNATGFRFAQEGSVNVFYWVDSDLAYALSASLPKADLGRVASAVYDQLEKR